MTRKVWAECRACNGTGISSAGNPCRPCQVHGEPVQEELELPAEAPKTDDPALDGFV